MRLAAALAALLALAAPIAPAAAQSVTHGVEGRFGVVHDSGANGTRAVYDTEYTMTIRQPFDNGWSVAVEVSVGAGNVERRGPRDHPGPRPGLRLTAPGS